MTAQRVRAAHVMGTWNDGLQYASLTDVGMRRRNNQDSYRVVLAPDETSWRERGHVFMVADGMGAHAAGELASKLAVDNIPHLYLKHRELPAPDALEKAIRDTNSEVNRRGSANPEFHSMGTTTSVLVLLPEGAIAAHIGDSRIYRLRGNQLEQLTFDHSLVWELRRDGNLPPGTDLAALPKNVITRSLGPNPTVELDLEGPFPLEPGDTFLLCSDGLTGQVSDAELAPILRNLPPEEAVQVLVDLANLRGGPDNVTVIVARVSPAGIVHAADAKGPPTAAREAREIHPAVWVATGVFGLAAVGMLLAKQYLYAIGPAAVAALVWGVGYWGRWQSQFGGSSFGKGRMLGQGPHTRLTCSTPAEFLANLGRMTDDLRAAASDKNFNLSTFNSLCDQAKSAADKGIAEEALRCYARAISSLMREFRRRRPGDSALDL